jgi:hypothetical protein
MMPNLKGCIAAERSDQFTGFCQAVVRSRSLSSSFFALSVTPSASRASHRISCAQSHGDFWSSMLVYDEMVQP